MYFTKSFLLVAMAVSASALSTPHVARNVHHRRHTAVARDAVPEVPTVPVVATTVVPRKRLVKRCKTKSPTSTLVSSSASATPSSSSVVITSSIDLQPSSAANNVGANPPSFSSSVAAPTPSADPAPVPSTSDTPAPAPSSSSEPAPAPTPSSSPAPAPAPTSSAPPAPSPSSSEPPAPSPTSAPAPAPSSSGGGGNSNPLFTETHSGDATFYATGLGACGITNNDNDHIVAVSKLLFDTFPGYDGANPNNNPICGMKATASYGGKSVQVTITDRCEACAMFSLDFAPSAFNILADPSIGRLHDMTWVFDL